MDMPASIHHTEQKRGWISRYSGFYMYQNENNYSGRGRAAGLFGHVEMITKVYNSGGVPYFIGRNDQLRE